MTEPAFDPIDTLARLDDDVELLAELVESFPNDASAGMGEIRRKLHGGDSEGLARAAHTLLGLLTIFAAAPAIRATLEIERAARDGMLHGVEAQLTDLESMLRRLECDLASFMTQVA